MLTVVILTDIDFLFSFLCGTFLTLNSYNTVKNILTVLIIFYFLFFKTVWSCFTKTTLCNIVGLKSSTYSTFWYDSTHFFWYSMKIHNNNINLMIPCTIITQICTFSIQCLLLFICIESFPFYVQNHWLHSNFLIQHYCFNKCLSHWFPILKFL